MDNDGYPNDKELAAIKEWDVLKSNVSGLLDFVEDRWHWSDTYIVRKENKVELYTGGGSGNESIVGALQENIMFWAMCWMKSERGGHYCFEIPKTLQNVTQGG